MFLKLGLILLNGTSRDGMGLNGVNFFFGIEYYINDYKWMFKKWKPVASTFRHCSHRTTIILAYFSASFWGCYIPYMLCNDTHITCVFSYYG